MDSDNNASGAEPVYVIESIPVGGEHELDPEAIRVEGIPTPAHLRVFEELARGAMGRIHPATDRNLLRHVALKRMDKKYAGERFYRDAFIAEAQITGQLEHANIVPVHELSLEGGAPYFTMKLIHGVSFQRWLQDPLHIVGSSERLEQGLEIFVKVCDALAYAHHRGVIHRDLKPENIMVASFGQVYLMDWGLARLTRTTPASGKAAAMEARGPVGTPEYMAPEQARGEPAEMSERSDIFGLGAVLYELVSGRRPYGDHRDQNVILERAQAGAVVPIESAVMGINVPKRIRAVIAKATAADPADRHATVTELQHDIQTFLRGGLHLPRKVFAAGTIIMNEGERGDAAYMILTGSCQASRSVSGRKEVLSTMMPGDVFGEMALLLDEPRAATVEALTPVTALVLDSHTMTEGLGVNGWTGALVRALAQRFRALEQQVRDSGMARGP
ncbi:MAG TPA: protein kinase [Polyangiaceae bacterium]|nr:protein kinase [Polyangiaceae bacterium]